MLEKNVLLLLPDHTLSICSARLHQKRVYSILLRSVAHSVIKLTADPRYLGGLPGVMAVLHTLGSNLAYHSHVYCLVTGGGVSSDHQKWLSATDGYLVPVKALSRLFRGIFPDNIRRQFKDTQLPESIWQKDWVVYCKPAAQSTRKVLDYLGRYVRRSNSYSSGSYDNTGASMPRQYDQSPSLTLSDNQSVLSN